MAGRARCSNPPASEPVEGRLGAQSAEAENNVTAMTSASEGVTGKRTADVRHLDLRQGKRRKAEPAAEAARSSGDAPQAGKDGNATAAAAAADAAGDDSTRLGEETPTDARRAKRTRNADTPAGDDNSPASAAVQTRGAGYRSADEAPEEELVKGPVVGFQFYALEHGLTAGTDVDLVSETAVDCKTKVETAHPNGPPKNQPQWSLRTLLVSGAMAGLRVEYSKGDFRHLTGIINQGGQILDDETGRIFAISAWEEHAGSKERRPAANIQLPELGLSLKQFAEWINSKGVDASIGHCFECKAGGQLICCDTCALAFHQECLGELADDIPEEDEWQCPYCAQPATRTAPHRSIKVRHLDRLKAQQQQQQPAGSSAGGGADRPQTSVAAGGGGGGGRGRGRRSKIAQGGRDGQNATAKTPEGDSSPVADAAAGGSPVRGSRQLRRTASEGAARPVLTPAATDAEEGDAGPSDEEPDGGSASAGEAEEGGIEKEKEESKGKISLGAPTRAGSPSEGAKPRGGAGSGGNRNSNKHKRLFMGEPGGLKDGEKVKYMANGETLLEGTVRIEPGGISGIVCHHCDSIVSCSQFEAHAGRGTRRAPYDSIYTEAGITLRQLAAQLPVLPADQWNAMQKSFVGAPGRFQRRASAAAAQKNRPAGRRPASASSPQISSALQGVADSCRDLIANLDHIATGCVICQTPEFLRLEDGFGERTMMICDQCEREYHVGCLDHTKKMTLPGVPEQDWFCSGPCARIHTLLTAHLLLRDVPIQPGSLHSVQVVHGRDGHPDTSRTLKTILEILQQSFDPIPDLATGEDLLPAMVYSEQFGEWDYTGMYAMLLRFQGQPTAAAIIRVLGPQIAEMPLVATRLRKRRRGHAKVLVNAILDLLRSAGVSTAMLPAMKTTITAWEQGFGFSRLSELELHYVRSNYRLLVFPDATVMKLAVPEHSGTADAMAISRARCLPEPAPRSLPPSRMMPPPPGRAAPSDRRSGRSLPPAAPPPPQPPPLPRPPCGAEGADLKDGMLVGPAADAANMLAAALGCSPPLPAAAAAGDDDGPDPAEEAHGEMELLLASLGKPARGVEYDTEMLSSMRYGLQVTGSRAAANAAARREPTQPSPAPAPAPALTATTPWPPAAGEDVPAAAAPSGSEAQPQEEPQQEGQPSAAIAAPAPEVPASIPAAEPAASSAPAPAPRPPAEPDAGDARPDGVDAAVASASAADASQQGGPQEEEGDDGGDDGIDNISSDEDDGEDAGGKGGGKGGRALPLTAPLPSWMQVQWPIGARDGERLLREFGRHKPLFVEDEVLMMPFGSALMVNGNIIPMTDEGGPGLPASSCPQDDDLHELVLEAYGCASSEGKAYLDTKEHLPCLICRPELADNPTFSLVPGLAKEEEPGNDGEGLDAPPPVEEQDLLSSEQQPGDGGGDADEDREEEIAGQGMVEQEPGLEADDTAAAAAADAAATAAEGLMEMETANGADAGPLFDAHCALMTGKNQVMLDSTGYDAAVSDEQGMDVDIGTAPSPPPDLEAADAGHWLDAGVRTWPRVKAVACAMVEEIDAKKLPPQEIGNGAL